MLSRATVKGFKRIEKATSALIQELQQGWAHGSGERGEGLHKAEAVAQQGGGCTGLRASEQVAAGLFAVTFGPTPQLLNQGKGGGKEEGRGERRAEGEERGRERLFHYLLSLSGFKA